MLCIISPLKTLKIAKTELRICFGDAQTFSGARGCKVVTAVVAEQVEGGVGSLVPGSP